MLISKSNMCNKCGGPHSNDCVAYYENGWYCFSCGAGSSTNSDYRPKGVLQTHNIYIPEDIVTDFNYMSLEVQEWLLRYQVYSELIRQYNIMYVSYDKFLLKSGRSYSGDSLIFPIIDSDNSLVYYQRRFFPNKQILTVGNSDAIFVTNNNSFSDKKLDTIVLVEDYISTIRVGQVVDCMCLFGTKLKQIHLHYLLRYYKSIIIWLDGDTPGQDGAKKIQNKITKELNYSCRTNAFKEQSYTIKNIITNKDPKCFTRTEICSILNINNSSGNL